MLRLLLVRHGETDWNKSLRYQGQTDTPLNVTGMRQAQCISQRLEKEPILAVYSSDLKRAVQTAEAIATKLNVAVITSPDLRELDFGEFEGLTFGEIQQRYPDSHRRWTSQIVDVPPPGGESLKQLARRVARLVTRIKREHPEGTVAVVGHGGSIRAMVCILLEIDLKHWWQIRTDSTSLTIFDVYPEGAVLSLLNDTSHCEGVIFHLL